MGTSRQERRTRGGLGIANRGFTAATSRELVQVLEEPMRSAEDQLAVAKDCLDIIRDREGLTVALVFDDTDSWLDTEYQPRAVEVRQQFFAMLPRLLAERLPSAAVIAVHRHYLDDAQYRRSREFLTEVAVPPLPNAAALAKIVQHRIDCGRTRAQCREVIDEAALGQLFDWYSGADGHNLRNVIRALERAVQLASEAGRPLVDEAATAQAIAQI